MNESQFKRALTGRPIFRDLVAERAEQERQEAMRRAAAEGALWQLAELHMPADVREAAARWKLDAVMTEMWRSAWIAGWRAAYETRGET